MTLAQLPALQVILPLIAAPLCLLLRSGRLAWLLSILVSATALIIAVLLLRLVLENGTVIYTYGGWAAPWGIEYRVDIANAVCVGNRYQYQHRRIAVFTGRCFLGD